MEEKYFISYSRGSVYSDDTKDAIIIIDEEKTSENLDELISRINYDADQSIFGLVKRMLLILAKS